MKAYLLNLSHSVVTIPLFRVADFSKNKCFINISCASSGLKIINISLSMSPSEDTCISSNDKMVAVKLFTVSKVFNCSSALHQSVVKSINATNAF